MMFCCVCTECGHEWECEGAIVNGWNVPSDSECPSCGSLDLDTWPVGSDYEDEEN